MLTEERKDGDGGLVGVVVSLAAATETYTDAAQYNERAISGDLYPVFMLWLSLRMFTISPAAMRERVRLSCLTDAGKEGSLSAFS